MQVPTLNTKPVTDKCNKTRWTDLTAGLTQLRRKLMNWETAQKKEWRTAAKTRKRPRKGKRL